MSLRVSECHYMSVNVTTCQWMSLHVGECHYVSVNVTTCQSMSLRASECHYVSVNVTMCQWMSLCVTTCQWMSLRVSECHYVSVNVTTCQWMSLCVSECHYVSVNVTMCHYVSVNVTACHCVSLCANVCRRRIPSRVNPSRSAPDQCRCSSPTQTPVPRPTSYLPPSPLVGRSRNSRPPCRGNRQCLAGRWRRSTRRHSRRPCHHNTRHLCDLSCASTACRGRRRRRSDCVGTHAARETRSTSAPAERWRHCRAANSRSCWGRTDSRAARGRDWRVGCDWTNTACPGNRKTTVLDRESN